MTGLSLQNLANLAEVIGAGTIVTGLLFGWFQIRQFRIQQRNNVATNLAQTFYSADLAKAITLIRNLPDGIPAEDMRAKGEEYEYAAVIITTSFETMGLLVFKDVASFDMVMDLAGGIVSVMHRKLVNWQSTIRIEQQQPSWGEWIEWLADRAGEMQQRETRAHIKYRDWRPK
jgi:hypothetical protein